MGEIRCPMCGKPNPDELDVCQFCEARLKPLIGPFEPVDAQEEKAPRRGGVTDWLDSFREQEEGKLSEAPADDLGEAEHDEADIPRAEDTIAEQPREEDWLAELRPDRGLEEDAEAVSTDRGEGEDWIAGDSSQAASIPDWLSDLGKSDQDFEATIPSPEEIEAPEVLPVSSPLDASDQEALAVEAPDLGEEVISPLEAEPGEEEPAVASKEEIPDWLKGFIESEPEGEPASLVEAAEPVEAQPGQMPDWLAELEETAGLETPSHILKIEPEPEEVEWEALQPDQVELEAEIERPTSPEDLQTVAPFSLDEEEISLGVSDMPEWLAEAPAVESTEEAPALEEEDASLTRAELPGWLEAMRPVEAAATAAPFTEDGDQEVESRGPLAGLRGVLPIEPEITQLKKPSTYALKLQVSDSQRKHASLFEELISKEGVAAPVEAGSAISPQNVLRVVIFVLLLIAVGWPIYTGSQNAGLPAPAREIDQTSQLINQVMVMEPILLAVDYEPGFSGEMDATAASIVDHLMIRGAYLVLVSTSPTGPAQAERLIKTVNSRAGHSYQDASQYANLGYVPGGPAGLLSFAQVPRQVTPFGIEGKLVWEAAPLANIQTLADFSIIVVITESPETARAWIEQVQPTLADTEMILVVSAQAEPLVRPYYEGYPQQVYGMVTGLAGGAAYEGNTPRALFARKYWDAFSNGSILAVLFILAGSAFFSISGILAKRKNAFGGKK